MKKIFTSILVIYIFFFFLEFSFNYFKKTEITEYKINDIYIKEDYKGNTKNEENNYYFEIKTKENTYYAQIFKDYKKQNQIITDIKYFKNNEYECLLPIFKNNKIETEVLCNYNNKQINYTNITNNEVIEFVDNLGLINYKDDKTKELKKGLSTFYVNNLEPNTYIALNYYKGIKIANKVSFTEYKLFEKDEYNQKIKAFYKDKYFIIDYNNKYESNEFKLVNIKTGKEETIGSNHVISFDAYVQGIIDDSIYIFDKDTKSQYQIDIKDKTITRIGNEKTGFKYYDGTWQNKNIYEAIKEEIKFKEYESNNEYVMIKNINGNNYGYNLYVKQINDKYEVYRDYRKNNILTYLFTTTDYSTIFSYKDSIYFKDGIYLKTYSQLTGIKTIIRDTELKNKSIIFYVGEEL